MIITYSIFWYLQMSKDFIFAWVTRTIYEPFFLLKFNFNIETFGSRKITIDDFCWDTLTVAQQNLISIFILVNPEECMVVIYKELTFRVTIIKLCLRYHKYINRTFESSLSISNLLLNKFMFSCLNINSFKLLMRIFFNTCFC